MRTSEDPFDALLLDEAPDSPQPTPPQSSASASAGNLLGAATARLEGFSVDDQPLIARVPGLPGEIVSARTTIPLLQRQIGSSVVVLFEGGDARRPVVVGVLQEPSCTEVAISAPRTVSVDVDEHRIVLSAEREIVLRCGKSSVTLTRAGKIIIQGEYISSRASGVNRIKGGSVQIN